MRIKFERNLEGIHGGLRLVQHHREPADATIDPGVATIGGECLPASLQRLREPAPLRQDIGTSQQTGRGLRAGGSHDRAA